MSNILDKITATKRREAEGAHRLGIDAMVRDAALRCPHRPVSLRESVTRSKGGIIAEFKRRSPSRSTISLGAGPGETTAGYERGGAAGCSVLTDTPYFGGSLTDLAVARSSVTLPLLRKDFMVDPYQVYEARAYGADAILLIAAILSCDEIREMTATAHSLGLEVLLELHDADELGKVIDEVDLVGVNNRNLTDFTVDIQTSLRLLPHLPSRTVKISESGIESPEAIRRLSEAGYDGFLIGTAFMATDSPAESLRSLLLQI